jgi:hypothetical protein
VIENPEISIDYSLSYREFVAGQKLAVRQSVPILLVHILARYIALAVALLLVAMALINLFNGHGSTVPPIIPLIFLFFLMPSTIWISWRYSYKRLKLTPSQPPQMTFQSDKNSFARQIHMMGDLTWLWSATHSIAQNKRVVIIAARKGAFIILPRRVVTDLQIARLKDLLRENKGPSC